MRETLNLSICADGITDTKKSGKKAHWSCVVCHPPTTLCNFSRYESPRMLGDALKGGLVRGGFFLL